MKRLFTILCFLNLVLSSISQAQTVNFVPKQPITIAKGTENEIAVVSPKSVAWVQAYADVPINSDFCVFQIQNRATSNYVIQGSLDVSNVNIDPKTHEAVIIAITPTHEGVGIACLRMVGTNKTVGYGIVETFNLLNRIGSIRPVK